MPEMLFESIEKKRDHYETAIYFADYEYGLLAGELDVVPKAESIDTVLPLWLIEYIKWKPKKTKQDEETLRKVEKWEAISR